MRDDVQEKRELEERLGRVEALVNEVESLGDPAIRDKAREIVEAVLDLHGAALAKVIAIAQQQGERGSGLLTALTSDEVVSSVLLLHDLHPRDLPARVHLALDRVRTGLVLKGARGEVVGISEDGVVKVRIVQEALGCGSDPGRVRALVEEALARAAPDATGLEIELVTEPRSPLIPLDSLRTPRPNGASIDRAA